ncbi:hypothetical protein SAMN05421820_101439 [Pedobacter steynii]|uniref:Uncharacterized protein n=1 Tax=Pedobacter steynii TaxID=430522 RepID=A0A1G9K1F5_9SPHI|nr:hypothetical protein [Pedobacter steynii]NQX38419.1 hypothetical protein [Pedobacter steynii]SDL43631.1 hypothetical protein SAMN05421820_101439 [Pedobacter steynii]
MKPSFTCLYFLENEKHLILEIKRTDLPQDAELSEVFLWLVMEKERKLILPLTFRSMDSSGEVQERFFEQGYLKFNNLTGTYIEKFNSGQHQLGNKSGNPLQAEIIDIIAEYLA